MRVGGGEINLVVNLDFFARRSRLPTLRLNECAVPEFRDISSRSLLIESPVRKHRLALLALPFPSQAEKGEPTSDDESHPAYPYRH